MKGKGRAAILELLESAGKGKEDWARGRGKGGKSRGHYDEEEEDWGKGRGHYEEEEEDWGRSSGGKSRKGEDWGRSRGKGWAEEERGWGGPAPGVSRGKSKGKGNWREEEEAAWEGSVPRVWAGGIPKGAANEDDLHAYFSVFGEVKAVEVKMGSNGQPRGFAFIDFFSMEDAQSAVANVDGLMYADKLLDVKMADPDMITEGQAPDAAKKKGGFAKGKGKPKGKGKDLEELATSKIFVGGLPTGGSEKAVRQHFEQFGPMQEVVFKKKEYGSGDYCGFAFITFEAIEHAKAVLDNYDHNMFEGKWIDCKACTPNDGHGGRKGGGLKRGFVEDSVVVAENLPPSGVTEEVLHDFFGYYGAVREVQIDWDNSSAQINFETPEIAASVLNAHVTVDFHGKELFLSGTAGQSRKHFKGGKGGKDEPTDKIFLAVVPKDFTEEKMVEYYGRFGVVKELALPFDTATGELRGFGFITFEDCESAAKAAAEGRIGEPRLDYGTRKGGKRAEEAPAPEDVFLKVSDLPLEPKQRDVFKLFYNYSTARIRDLDNEAIVEFCSVGECQRAFQDKQGSRMGANRVILSGATREEYMAMKAKQEALVRGAPRSGSSDGGWAAKQFAASQQRLPQGGFGGRQDLL